MAAPDVSIRRAGRAIVGRRGRNGAEAVFDEEGAPVALLQAVPTTKRRATPVGELVGISLTLVAVLVGGFLAYLFWWSNLQAGHDQRRLLSTFAVSGERQGFASRTPPEGSLVAILEVPALGLHEAVVEGTSSTDLQTGPGLMPATALPGSIGDSVIAGRRGTFGAPFARIGQLRPGDLVKVTDYEGNLTYVVRSIRTISGGGRIEITRTRSPLLTLVTSASSFPPAGLVVVTAALHGTPGKAAASSPLSSHATASQLALGGDTSRWWELAGWALLLICSLVVTVAAYRRARRPFLVYLLSTPVVVLTMLLTFENLARLLPATM